MSLETYDAQKIVDRLMNILGKNINLINTEGIIIASGDKNRINTFHEAALTASSQRQNIIVDNGNIENFEGSKPGVNIPIYNNNEVLGVVGITGEPSEVQGYGLVVKELVELMIQEEERKKFQLFQSRAVRSFAKEIIKYNEKMDMEILNSRAQLVNFDCTIPRIVVAADICNFASLMNSYDAKTEIVIQSLKQQIVDIINSISNPRFDVAFNLSEDRFIIFKNLDEDIADYCQRVLDEVFKKTGLKLYIGIGSLCNSMMDYYNSYTLANKTLNVGRKLHPTKYIYFSEDYRFHLLLKTVDNVHRAEYLKSLRNIFEMPLDHNRTELLTTVKAYFENGMNIKETSKALFIHRNTLLYRINKFKELFEFDITVPYNCMMVYMGITLIDLDKDMA